MYIHPWIEKRSGLWSVSRKKSSENPCLVFQPENKPPQKHQWLASSHAYVFLKSQLLWQQQLRRWRIVKTLEVPSHMSLNNIKFCITISLWEAFERHFVLFRLKWVLNVLCHTCTVHLALRKYKCWMVKWVRLRFQQYGVLYGHYGTSSDFFNSIFQYSCSTCRLKVILIIPPLHGVHEAKPVSAP